MINLETKYSYECYVPFCPIIEYKYQIFVQWKNLYAIKAKGNENGKRYMQFKKYCLICIHMSLSKVHNML